MNYEHLALLGKQYPLTYQLPNPHQKVAITEEQFEYVKYNPRKDIDRWGLSLTSLDGEMSGIPDLDSLLEYNIC